MRTLSRLLPLSSKRGRKIVRLRGYMLNIRREAWQREHNEITFSDFHHWVGALFSARVCARGRIRGLTYMRMYLDIPL